MSSRPAHLFIEIEMATEIFTQQLDAGLEEDQASS
jgi:hypothetical protein